MGEFDLMSTAFIFDLCLYYLGVASRPYRYGENALLVPPFSGSGTGPIFRFMRGYNRRFAVIARRRRKRRMLGKTNRAHRCLIPGFKLHSANPRLFAQGFVKWARVELGELFPEAPARMTFTGTSADIPANRPVVQRSSE
jgi:hypothetical protein